MSGCCCPTSKLSVCIQAPSEKSAEMIDDYALELTSNGKVIAFNVAKFKGIYMCLVKEGNVEDENKPGFYQLTIPVERITATTVEDELHFILQWYNNRLLHCIDTS